MGRPTSNKGFLLVEACLVLLALSILSTLYLSMQDIEISAYKAFPDAYLDEQSEALKQGKEREFVQDDIHVSFNEAGNVSQARTIPFGKRRIIIELGGGRLVFPH